MKRQEMAKLLLLYYLSSTVVTAQAFASSFASSSSSQNQRNQRQQQVLLHSSSAAQSPRSIYTNNSRGGAIQHRRRRPSRSPTRQQQQQQEKKKNNNNNKTQQVTSSKNNSNKSIITASCFNLVNNVAGAGILALAAGTKGTGTVPAVGLCAVLGALSARTFVMIGEACAWTRQEDFKGLWSATLGASTTHVVDIMICILCTSCAVIYSGILGDLLTQLWPANRARNILAVTTGLLLPMSLIKNLSALAFTSVLGFGAIAYTVLFIVWRALDGSYALPLGRFVAESATPAVAALPSFAQASRWNINFASLVLISNLGLAYIAHYNGPNFYRNLKDTSPARFGRMVNWSFFVLVALYAATMVAGYSTFGDACKGNILLNYHASDSLALLGRMATFVSILFGFPLVLTGAREGVAGAASSMGWPAVADDRHHFSLVASILTVVTTISCLVKDVSLVVGLTGASMGSFIVYICPALLYTRAARLVHGKGSKLDKAARKYLLLVPFGLLVGGLGVFMTVSAAGK